MIATQCPTPDTLHALSTGRLEETQSEPLLEHLRDCQRCRSELETLQDAEDSIVALLRQPSEGCEYDVEPDCKRALAKALGALAIAGETAPDSDWQQLPETIGEYEILRPLGRGGMGRVFLARHSKLGRQVALKLALIDRLADPRVRRRFETEMRAVGKLSHPNIVTAHDAREIDGTAVLVTEYINGLDLAQLVRRAGPLAIPDACAIICQVAYALQYIADEGFVHRDVKPSNIMLSSDGQVKLLDLGLARFHGNDDASEMTGTGQAMGTADYVAPEQVTDGRSLDIRADIYSLGCTLFHLLTGSPPFDSEAYPTAFAKMNAHVSTAAPSLASRRGDCPVEVTKLVDAMLGKQPARRPSQPVEVATRLEKHATGANLQALAARGRSGSGTAGRGGTADRNGSATSAAAVDAAQNPSTGRDCGGPAGVCWRAGTGDHHHDYPSRRLPSRRCRARGQRRQHPQCRGGAGAAACRSKSKRSVGTRPRAAASRSVPKVRRLLAGPGNQQPRGAARQWRRPCCRRKGAPFTCCKTANWLRQVDLKRQKEHRRSLFRLRILLLLTKSVGYPSQGTSPVTIHSHPLPIHLLA